MFKVAPLATAMKSKDLKINGYKMRPLRLTQKKQKTHISFHYYTRTVSKTSATTNACATRTKEILCDP